MDMGEGQEKAAGKNEPCINTQLAAAITEIFHEMAILHPEVLLVP
jgi:hypothetical protein